MTRPIAESEMILNDRGGIYHLDLKPDELAPMVITVGDPARVGEISKHFDHIDHRSAHREFITHTGSLGSKRISVLSTGIGPDNIDIVMNELDALVNIDFETRSILENPRSLQIIRMGTCGGLQPDIPTDGLIASSHGLGLDNLMLYYAFDTAAPWRPLLAAFLNHTQVGDYGIKPYLAGADESLLQAFVQAGYSQGITATCPGFYGPQGRTLRAAPALPGLPALLSSFRLGEWRITNFEMETSAIYALGQVLGHQCLSINTVVANRSTHQFSKDKKKAIEKMIERSLAVLASYENPDTLSQS